MRYFGRQLACLVGIAIGGMASEAIAQSPSLLAQTHSLDVEPFAIWVLRCLGLFGFLTLLSGLMLFVGAWLVVFLARRPAVIAAYLVFLLFPLLFGILGPLKSLVSVCGEVSRAGVELKQAAIFGVLAEVLLLPLTALLMTIPSYLVIAIGLFVRTLRADGGPAIQSRMAESPPFDKRSDAQHGASR